MAGITDIITNLENTISNFFNTANTFVNIGNTQYKVVKLSSGEYDLGLALPGLGTQHLRIAITGDDFTIKGSFNVIANNASWPFSLASTVVNNAVENFFKAALDSQVSNGAPLAISHTVVPQLQNPIVIHDNCEDGKCKE